jgi:hypothetical protein
MNEPRTIAVELDAEELECLEALCRGETVGGKVAEADRLGDKLASRRAELEDDE